tara:strand:+ start:675 stop:1994 length:1320 start_codon:yes stop_codon:yes gene_type:complete
MFLKIKNLAKKRLKNLSLFTFSTFYFIFIISIILLSSIYCYLSISKYGIADENFQIIFKKLQFDFGNLAHNFYYNNDFFQNRNGVDYYLFKSPFLPFLLVSIAKISNNIYFIFITKNLITYSILFFSLFFLLKKYNKNVILFAFILILFLINPYNLHVGFNIFFEDNLLALLLPSLFLILNLDNDKKFFFSSLIIFVLYNTKSSMFFFSLFLPFLILFLEKKKIHIKIIPVFGLIFAISLWGLFGLEKTGKFPFAGKLITSNSEALNHVILNDKFLDYYPYKSVDLIPKDISIPQNLKNEWEIFDYYNQKNKDYLRNNFTSYLLTFPEKIKFIFFNIYKDSLFPDDKSVYNNKIMISYLLNKIFFNLAILLLIMELYKKYKNKRILEYGKLDIYFLFFLIFSLFPHLIAWATAKHLVAIQQISMIYLCLKLSNKFKIFN